MPTETKKCSKCGEVKPLAAFSSSKECRNGYTNVCKTCRNEQQRLARAANPEASKQRYRNYYQRNKASENARSRAYHAEHPEQFMVTCAAGRARRAGVPCTITPADIVIPKVCPVLGITMTRGSGRHIDSSPSLDRIIPELGYVPGNVAVISWRANRIKSDASAEELQKISAWVTKVGGQA